jgi:hypothetical protein
VLISPDGRHAAAPLIPWVNGVAAPAEIILIDLDSGATRLLDLDPATAAVAVTVQSAVVKSDGTATLGSDPHSVDIDWHPDSRHLMVGNAIVDLAGRRTGTVPMPSRSWMIALRPGGAGLLVVPDDAHDTYEATSSSGSVDHRVTIRWECSDGRTTERSEPCPTTWRDGFLGWRGPDRILIASGEQPYGHGIDAVDLRTGRRTAVHRDDQRIIMVVPADHLSARAREAVAF